MLASILPCGPFLTLRFSSPLSAYLSPILQLAPGDRQYTLCGLGKSVVISHARKDGKVYIALRNLSNYTMRPQLRIAFAYPIWQFILFFTSVGQLTIKAMALLLMPARSSRFPITISSTIVAECFVESSFPSNLLCQQFRQAS